MARLSENNPYPKSVEEVKTHIRQTIQERRFTKLDESILEEWQPKYPDLTKIEIITVFWLQRCIEHIYFHGKTSEEVREYVKRCENGESVRKNPNLTWETRTRIKYALQAGNEYFNGTTQKDAEEYLDRYYQKLAKKELTISKEEIQYYSMGKENTIKNHLQGSICQKCHNNISPCHECPHYKSRWLQAK